MYVTLTNNEVALDTLTLIAEGEMDLYFHDTILDRAENYYDGRYWTLGTVGAGSLHATVRGTRIYSVQLRADVSGMHLDCSCPYEDDCKHLAAFVWLITEEWRAELERALAGNELEEEAFTAHLDRLTKVELRKLVHRFAPPGYRQSILLEAAPEDTVEHEFQVVLGRLEWLFGAREYYEGPSDYEAELEVRLKELEPFLHLRGRALLGVLRDVWVDINRRMGDGELYDDYSDGPLDSGVLIGFTARLLFAQPAGEQASYLRALRRLREQVEEYDTFSDMLSTILEQAPDETALRQLLPVLLEQETIDMADRSERRMLIDRLRPLLNPGQERQLLEALIDNKDFYFNVALARLLERQESKEAARKFLGQALGNYPSYGYDGPAAFQYLAELTATTRGESAEWAVLTDYLQRIGDAAGLRFAIARRPELAEEFVQLVEAGQPFFLLQYFIEEDDHARAVSLLDRHEELWDTRQAYDLLLRYATTYPDHARKLAYRMLDEQLFHAHRNAYAEVVRALQLLRAAGPVEKLQRVVSGIRATYGRRRRCRTVVKTWQWALQSVPLRN